MGGYEGLAVMPRVARPAARDQVSPALSPVGACKQRLPSSRTDGGSHRLLNFRKPKQVNGGGLD